MHILVTGGGSGIGRAIALKFMEAGARVAIAGRNEEKLQETKAMAQSRAGGGEPILVHAADVSDRRSTQALFQWAFQQLESIDVLVLAAGINIKNRSMAAMQPQQWDEVLAINATGVYNCMYYALPGMRERKSGLIVNISSISGKRAYDLGGIAYCASKFAATALGTATGQEEASHGIRVTNVYPGEVDTPILDQRPQPVSDEHRQKILQPQDVADIVWAIAQLPARAHVPEIVIKPRLQTYV